MNYFDNQQIIREKGIFFTPLNFVKLGLNYIEKTLGQQWWKTGEYRIWDMAAGTGNLEYHLPVEALKYCYLSTIYKEDVLHCTNLFPQANSFQYDYLNDDIENIFALSNTENWKLPEKLRDDLHNPYIKWLIYINPPYATSGNGATDSNSKTGVSDTKIRKIMHKQNLGEVSRELFSQFIFRIKKEFENNIAYLAMFSKIKYLNSNNDQKLRDKIFHFTFETGFIFSSANFSGTSKKLLFPVGFLVWNLSNKQILDNQIIEIEIFDEKAEICGSKRIIIEKKEKFLSKWIKRMPTIQKFPPFSSAITIKLKNKDTRDRIAKDFIASFLCTGNSFQNQNATSFASGPFVSAGALSVTPENFEKAMVIHAVRKIPKATWINDRDQFLQPTKELNNRFIIDCTIWTIFSNSNHTTALQNVEYCQQIYQINNNFFPFLLEEIRKWKCEDPKIVNSMENDHERFLAKWIASNIANMSQESLEILEAAKEIYKFYFANLKILSTEKYKIQTWDAGWWQIRNALNYLDLDINIFYDFKILHNKLRQKICPQIYEYGFL